MSHSANIPPTFNPPAMNQYTTIQSLIGQPVAVHCPTEAKANEFLKMCYAEGVEWKREGKENRWLFGGSNTYYTLIEPSIMYGDISLNDGNLTIITFSDFTNKTPSRTPEEIEFMDRCAIAAMQAEIQVKGGMSPLPTDIKSVAQKSIAMASAMLKAKQLLTNK